MSPLESLTLHFALCLVTSDKPAYHLMRMCKNAKKNSNDPYVQSIVRNLLRKSPEKMVDEILYYVNIHIEAGRFEPCN